MMGLVLITLSLAITPLRAHGLEQAWVSSVRLRRTSASFSCSIAMAASPARCEIVGAVLWFGAGAHPDESAGSDIDRRRSRAWARSVRLLHRLAY
jgi:hypothetical protein